MNGVMVTDRERVMSEQNEQARRDGIDLRFEESGVCPSCGAQRPDLSVGSVCGSCGHVEPDAEDEADDHGPGCDDYRPRNGMQAPCMTCEGSFDAHMGRPR